MKKQHLDRCLFPHKDIEMPVGKKENKFQKIPLRNVLLVTLRNDIK